MGLALKKGDTSIGMYTIPGRKKPCLCVCKGNMMTVYGSFHNAESGEEFMNELARLTGAIKEA